MTKIFAKPLGMLLDFIYGIVEGIGLDFKYLSAYAIAIIITTIVFKFLILPLSLKQMKSMKEMQKIQPLIKELQKKYKNDPQTLNIKTMELYKEHKVNPFGSCLPLLIQMPIIIGFFSMLRNPLTYVASYESITNKAFFWIKDIGFSHKEMVDGVINGFDIGFNIPFIGTALPILAILAGVTTYLQSKMMSANNNQVVDEKAATTQKTMTTFMPIMIFFFALNMPAGLTIYWVVGNIFQIVQQYLINLPKNKLGGIE
ncbi:YidC/Oxa1 family membrane protein insertase [Clostridiaceae bacterium M8S5]|nr:YidC/Oxa1 family membrane protein insertase [Clostridiaceae bacterium M8S5]